jgi:DNA-binding NarL/FixJ family response regulator
MLHKYRICIVEDDPITAEAICTIINTMTAYELAGVYTNAEDYMDDFTFIKPDITLMDIDLPGISGIEAIEKIKSGCVTQIIILTNHEEKEELFSALKAGADGYLLKKDSVEILPNLLRDIEQGGAAITPSVAKKILNYFKPTPKDKTIETLNEKEMKILKSLVDGLLYKEIASDMNLSIDSIKKYASNIYAKLHVRTRSEAIKKYLS